MTTDPNGPEGVDTTGKSVPPYEGRRESADVGGPEKSTKDGARTGGATGPVEVDAMPETDLDDDGVGPAHESGTGRAENKP